jgi:hypothetical protein
MLLSTGRARSLYADNSDNYPSFFLKCGLSELGPTLGLGKPYRTAQDDRVTLS